MAVVRGYQLKERMSPLRAAVRLKENQIPLSKYELHINLNSIYKGFKSLIQDYFDVQ